MNVRGGGSFCLGLGNRVLAEPRPCHDLRSLYPHLLEIAVDHLAQRHPALLSSDGNLLQK